MTFEEALEAVQKLPAADHYLALKVNYYRFLVPYEDGLQILKAFRHAELWDDWHTVRPRITPLPPAQVEVSLVSKLDYQRMKIAMMMQVSLQELPDTTDLSLRPS